MLKLIKTRITAFKEYRVSNPCIMCTNRLHLMLYDHEYILQTLPKYLNFWYLIS